MSDSTNFLRELLELDERQDATNVDPQVTSSPVSALVKDMVPVFRPRALLSQNSRDIFFLS